MVKTEKSKATGHKWQFKARFRQRAFGWKSQPAITRVKEALAEIKKAVKLDPCLAAEGSVSLIERLSPALEQVDSSSGAIGSAVNRAIEELVPLIGQAPASKELREQWLERLFEAHANDDIPYIEQLADFWGDLCGSKDVASEWADRLIGTTRLALSPDKTVRGIFHGTSMCLSALLRSERYAAIIELLRDEKFWHYKLWAVKGLAAQGKKAEAIRLAESCRGPWSNDYQIDHMCEEILLSSGLVDEAYARYGVSANRGGTYLATFRAVMKKYPQKPPSEVLSDLVKTTPGEEGKWFAAAKDAGLYAEAIELARRTPCDPKTLTRAARDFAVKQPAFALEAGRLALSWLVEGYGYEITSVEVWAAYRETMRVAEGIGHAAEMKEVIRKMVALETAADRFVRKVLGHELGL